MCSWTIFRVNGPDYGLGSCINRNGALYYGHHYRKEVFGFEHRRPNPDCYANRPSTMPGCWMALTKNE